MAFKNEVVSDENIDRYNLPFPKGEGRWWTRDAERDYYLWGGIVGNRAYDTDTRSIFYLYTDRRVHTFLIYPGKDSPSLKDSTYLVEWDAVGQINPSPKNNHEKSYLIEVLKEALTTYGQDGQDDMWTKKTKVFFNF